MTKCDYCRKDIILLWDKPVDDRFWGDVQPGTNYWNNERREIYCDPYCSLRRHEEWPSNTK